jgi:hypothetical protein
MKIGRKTRAKCFGRSGNREKGAYLSLISHSAQPVIGAYIAPAVYDVFPYSSFFINYTNIDLFNHDNIYDLKYS